MLVIDNFGKIIEHRISRHVKKEHAIKWIEHIANKVSIRFKIVDFKEELGGLAMTINVFEGNVMLVKSLNSNYTLVLIIPLENNLVNTIKTLSESVS